MPNTNITKEELKDKDEKKLVKDTDGRVVDILDLLDNPSSLEPSIRRRIVALQKYAKVSNQTIAERYGESSANIESLESVNERLLEVCKNLAKEESKNGFVFDENGNYDKKASIEKAMQLGISDMYDITTEKMNLNASKDIKGINKETNKLLENIFKEAEEKKNFKLSDNAKELFERPTVGGNFWDNFGNDKSDIDEKIENSNLKTETKNDIENAKRIIEGKNPIIMKFSRLFLDISNNPELSKDELYELMEKYPELSEEFSRIQKDGVNEIELNLYEAAFPVYYVGAKMAQLEDVDIKSLSEDEKKEFLTDALGVCDAPTSPEFLQDLNNVLNEMYPGLNIFNTKEIAAILIKSEDEVSHLQASTAAQYFSKNCMNYVTRKIEEIDASYENLVIKEYEILYYRTLTEPNADKSELEKLIKEHPEYREKFSEIEKKDFNDSKILNDIQLNKEYINKDVLLQMIDKLDTSTDGLSKEEKELFVRQTVATIGGGGTNEEELAKIQEAFGKLYPEKSINLNDPEDFMKQVGEILDINSEEVWYLISAEATDKNFENSINFLKRYNRAKKSQIVSGEKSKKPNEKITDEEMKDYLENEGVIIEENPNQATKGDEELTNEGAVPTVEDSSKLETEATKLDESRNEKIGFFGTIVAKIKNIFNRITGKQKLLSEGNSLLENNYNSANPREHKEVMQNESSVRNSFIPKAIVNEREAINQMKEKEAENEHSKVGQETEEIVQ